MQFLPAAQTSSHLTLLYAASHMSLLCWRLLSGQACGFQPGLCPKFLCRGAVLLLTALPDSLLETDIHLLKHLLCPTCSPLPSLVESLASQMTLIAFPPALLCLASPQHSTWRLQLLFSGAALR